jgi:hypothetical protein
MRRSPDAGRVRGSRNLYGIPLGVLMLESRFPRIPGDAGNAGTWPFPVLYRVVPGAAPGRVVRELEGSGLEDAFLDAALALERAGVAALTTNCGFLVLWQSRLQARLGVPLVSSSLLQVPAVAARLPPGRTVGILTIERCSLTPGHLAAAGIDEAVPVVGMEEVGGHFVDAILGDREELDVGRAREEHVAAARLLVERHPEVGAIVLECTNMPPYAGAIADATGLAVHDLTTYVGWLAGAHLRRPFTGWV